MMHMYVFVRLCTRFAFAEPLRLLLDQMVQDRMEKIFDTVMTSADLSISMEQWLAPQTRQQNHKMLTVMMMGRTALLHAWHEDGLCKDNGEDHSIDGTCKETLAAVAVQNYGWITKIPKMAG